MDKPKEEQSESTILLHNYDKKINQKYVILTDKELDTKELEMLTRLYKVYILEQNDKDKLITQLPQCEIYIANIGYKYTNIPPLLMWFSHNQQLLKDKNIISIFYKQSSQYKHIIPCDYVVEYLPMCNTVLDFHNKIRNDTIEPPEHHCWSICCQCCCCDLKVSDCLKGMCSLLCSFA